MQSKTATAPLTAAYSAQLLLCFAATMFLGAGLLFVVQPMVSGMVLPALGGSPSVWNTCLCFFQAILLAGYAYAHWLASRFDGRAQAMIHGTVLGVSMLFLPIDLTSRIPPADSTPVWWLLGTLAAAVGPPFFAVSATAPLLQRWFSRTDHPSAADPYFLYSASNAGSLLALLAYPLVLAPLLPLATQSRFWSFGIAALTFGIAGCWIVSHHRVAAVVAVDDTASSPAIGDRLRWIGYSFLPSGLLLAVTAHITTDLAAAPLFWVIPLAIYLTTFIIAFGRRPLLSHAAMLRMLPFLLIMVVIASVGNYGVWRLLPHLACFFVIAMVCHGALARSRPPVRNLTEFYLWVSIGGVLGGVFNALLAPALFPSIWEYPLLLAAAAFLPRNASANGLRMPLRDIAISLLLLFGYAALFHWDTQPRWAVLLAVGGGLVALLSFRERRWSFGFGVAACLLGLQFPGADVAAETRSFFGVNRVQTVAGGTVRILRHGTTVHGAQKLRVGDELQILSYYAPDGPFGRFLAAMNARGLSRVGVIGLGVGELACYATPGQSWTIHEIDPAVAMLARRYFHFLDRCGNDPRIILGDARLTLQSLPNGSYDALIIDAFNSDSIPVHLLTREALALYQRKLAPDGALLFHVSNLYLDLAPVIAALARDTGAPAVQMTYMPAESTIEHAASQVVAVGQPGHSLDFLTPAAGWKQPPPGGASALWTDQRSDIVSRMRWH
ncbi:MAG TPA: fused MFS/spermidine synthase [Stellaceae bacterium]|nr:fused MFS/spermidine synthase [Stellaceae bacterium]